MLNAFSVDLEDWHQAFDHLPPPPQGGYDSRVEPSLEVLLDVLESGESRGTFFVVGALARSHPHLVRTLVSRGHRIGCHGYGHRRLTEQTPAQFREDLTRARSILEDLTGGPVLGYRAPWFSLGDSTSWAIEILAESGFRYDSSLFPVWNPFYGSFKVPPRPYALHGTGPQALWEIPPAPTRWRGMPIPMAGGFYLRNAPVWLAREMLSWWNRQGWPAVVYTHPWELDPAQPRLAVTAVEKVIHYTGLGGYEGRLRRILEGFRFGPLEEVFGHLWSNLNPRS